VLWLLFLIWHQGWYSKWQGWYFWYDIRADIFVMTDILQTAIFAQLQWPSLNCFVQCFCWNYGWYFWHDIRADIFTLMVLLCLWYLALLQCINLKYFVQCFSWHYDWYFWHDIRADILQNAVLDCAVEYLSLCPIAKYWSKVGISTFNIAWYFCMKLGLIFCTIQS